MTVRATPARSGSPPTRWAGRCPRAPVTRWPARPFLRQWTVLLLGPPSGRRHGPRHGLAARWAGCRRLDGALTAPRSTRGSRAPLGVALSLLLSNAETTVTLGDYVGRDFHRNRRPGRPGDVSVACAGSIRCRSTIEWTRRGRDTSQQSSPAAETHRTQTGGRQSADPRRHVGPPRSSCGDVPRVRR